MAKIYLASSWRNTSYPLFLTALRANGHEVYDFKDPVSGFSWADIDPGFTDWSLDDYLKALRHPLAREGFMADKRALEWCDTCVMLLPCGKSAHLELGWAVGARKRTIIVMPDRDTPELMYRLADAIVTSLGELLGVLPPVPTPEPVSAGFLPGNEALRRFDEETDPCS